MPSVEEHRVERGVAVRLLPRRDEPVQRGHRWQQLKVWKRAARLLDADGGCGVAERKQRRVEAHQHHVDVLQVEGEDLQVIPLDHARREAEEAVEPDRTGLVRGRPEGAPLEILLHRAPYAEVRRPLRLPVGVELVGAVAQRALALAVWAPPAALDHNRGTEHFAPHVDVPDVEDGHPRLQLDGVIDGDGGGAPDRRWVTCSENLQTTSQSFSRK